MDEESFPQSLKMSAKETREKISRFYQQFPRNVRELALSNLHAMVESM
jgi:hypothetical protein